MAPFSMNKNSNPAYPSILTFTKKHLTDPFLPFSSLFPVVPSCSVASAAALPYPARDILLFNVVNSCFQNKLTVKT